MRVAAEHAAAQRERYAADPEKGRAIVAAYRERNRDRINAERRGPNGKPIRTAEQVAADVAAGSKVCTKCQERKPFAEFHRHRGFSDGYASSCKLCLIRRVKDRHTQLSTEDPEAWTAYRRAVTRKHRFGLTAEEFALMVQEQECCC